MKREIKFRVWDKEEKRMSQPLKLDGFGVHFEGDCVPIPFAARRVERFEWLQFTGLLDKNGKEIFDGDILKINGGAEDYFATVGYEHGCFVAIMHSKVEGSSNPELKYYLFDMSEVIGNAFENPELLR